MKFLTLPILLVSLASSASAFAGGGSCTDCYDAYRCTEASGQIKISITASYGNEFAGAMGWMTVSSEITPPGGQADSLNDKTAFLTATHLVLPFSISGNYGTPRYADSFELLLPRENWNQVKSAQGRLLKGDVEIPFECVGQGFDEGSEIKPGA